MASGSKDGVEVPLAHGANGGALQRRGALCGLRVGAGLRVAVQALGVHNSRIVHIGHITVQLCAETLDAKRVCAGILPQAVFDGSGVRSRVGRFPLVKATQRRQVRVVEEKVAATIDGCI